MVGLSLPRLHKDVPTVVASPKGEALLLDFLTQRAHANLPLPDLKASEPLVKVVNDMLDARLIPECNRMAAFDGEIALENAKARSSYDEDGFRDDEITLSYTPALNGVFFIGLALQRLELALPGAAETVMARLVAANEATMFPLALPDVVRDMALSYRWSEVPHDQTVPTIVDGVEDYTAADAVVREWYMEMYDSDPEDDDNLVLPSNLYKEMKGPFDYSSVFTPKVKVPLTEQAFIDAGYDPARAAQLVRRFEVEIPALIEKVKIVRNKHLQFDSSYGVASAVVVLGDEDTRALNVVDEILNDRMQSGAPGHVLRIATAPVVRRKLKQYRYAETNKRLDGVEIFADFINLLGQMDQVLRALSQ